MFRAEVKNAAIIGAGGWGTALAIVLARNVSKIRLWVFEPDLRETLTRMRTNPPYLPGFFLPVNVQPTGDLQEAIADAQVVFTVVPSQHLRSVLEQMSPFANPEQIFISATKGLEERTFRRMSEVITETLQSRFPPKLAVLSGPTFAREVARGVPTAVVIASAEQELARRLQQQFANPTLRFYTNTDVVGVELGGALKNIIAIGAGICEGLGLGSNAVAALITRGLAEITRLACACGARRETLAGLAGLGDLVLTCTGALSRNHRIGVELGRGRRLQEILDSMPMVAEGIYTTSAARQLAQQKGVEMPITEQMYAVLYGDRPPLEAVQELMERSLKAE
ncbi:MAG: NAD(P)-dependent glycerol-3-phosphate dehydrogenase [Acidobacteria bacterium]|nr:NAD(P)-dependent glycerol-3-phosphate dehydrogenase [Acidobacteriota bacterium]